MTFKSSQPDDQIRPRKKIAQLLMLGVKMWAFNFLFLTTCWT